MIENLRLVCQVVGAGVLLVFGVALALMLSEFLLEHPREAARRRRQVGVRPPPQIESWHARLDRLAREEGLRSLGVTKVVE